MHCHGNITERRYEGATEASFRALLIDVTCL
jgi:hypothetical protein